MCKSQHFNTDFCATATWITGEVPYLTCGDQEFCTLTGCSGSMYCKKPGDFVHDFPGLNNVILIITCCDTDLCNIESSA